MVLRGADVTPLSLCDGVGKSVCLVRIHPSGFSTTVAWFWLPVYCPTDAKVGRYSGAETKKYHSRPSTPSFALGAKHWDAWFGISTAVEFGTVVYQATQSVIQSVVDFYKSSLRRELTRFTELKDWVMKVNYPAGSEMMNRMVNDVFQSSDVFGVGRGAISVSAVIQMMEVEEWVAQPVEGTLSETDVQYRDYFARL